ncbi:hypothetical protein ACFCQI_04690 [Rhodanobacter sp. FW102-FHT14D06]|uniref:Apea-like HEPN domain-containing protein n=2 Tax=unclassified Rhodanobacter TaxID=2621553 RepID=A0AB74UQM3_9GAMM
MLTLELLEQNIAECRAAVEAGTEKSEVLQFFLNLHKDLANASESDWQAYNEIAENLPNEGADNVLVVLKGQLLIERLVHKFIHSRLPNPKAFKSQSFRFSQCIQIAEAMCLPNEEPAWLWQQVKELNTIRGQLAHELQPKNIDTRIHNFVTTIANTCNLSSHTPTSAVAHLYGMVKGLCDLSTDDPDFKAFKI